MIRGTEEASWNDEGVVGEQSLHQRIHITALQSNEAHRSRLGPHPRQLWMCLNQLGDCCPVLRDPCALRLQHPLGVYTLERLRVVTNLGERLMAEWGSYAS